MKSTKLKFIGNYPTISLMLVILLFMLSGCPQVVVEPVVNFGADRTIAGYGETILFIDSTQNEPTSWLWSFGDGNTSTNQEQ